MKLILSRKGIDDSYGNGKSVILPTGEMISFPIPSSDKEQGVHYSKINYATRNFDELYRELYPKRNSYKDVAHFDPDLRRGSLKRRNHEWKGVFGQIGGAQTQLSNNQISKGDVFLFFGTFAKSYINIKKQLEFERQHPFHAIFGYLQISDIILQPESNDKIRWDYNNHPHLMNSNLSTYRNNAIYIASDKFQNTELLGSGVFKYRRELRLTKPGFKKSVWELPNCFDIENGLNMSYHSDPSRFRKLNDKIQLQTVGMGQDFVVECNSEIMEWVRMIIINSQQY